MNQRSVSGSLHRNYSDVFYPLDRIVGNGDDGIISTLLRMRMKSGKNAHETDLIVLEESIGILFT